MTHVMFDAARRDRLQKRYDEAISAKEETFVFDGMELYTPYAGYMLEYLNTVV